jgi:hypothetical protein
VGRLPRGVESRENGIHAESDEEQIFTCRRPWQLPLRIMQQWTCELLRKIGSVFVAAHTPHPGENEVDEGAFPSDLSKSGETKKTADGSTLQMMFLRSRPLSWAIEVFRAADNFKAIIPISSSVTSVWFSRQEAAAHEEVGYILSRGADFLIMDQS